MRQSGLWELVIVKVLKVNGKGVWFRILHIRMHEQLCQAYPGVFSDPQITRSY